MDIGHMRRMGADEIDAYARSIGIATGGARDVEAKIRLVEKRRSRVATVCALGVDLDIPVKRAADMRVTDLLNKEGRTREDIREAFVTMLGERQYSELVAAATDEDGTVDEAALGFAFNSILDSPELKNF